MSADIRFPKMQNFLLAAFIAASLGSARELPVAAAQGPAQREFAAIERAPIWLNSGPLTADALRGKVVLIDFWAYSCINWRRTLPYVRAWSKTYAQQGLVVIGVHTPEFGFEGSVDNVRRATREFGIDYPVVIDGSHAIWSAFTNRYWPAIYLIDADGRLRYKQFGEGSYAASERVIQDLLVEAGANGVGRALQTVDARGFEADADWLNLGSPETYVGYERGEGFASPGGVVRDRRHVYAAPAALRRDTWALNGDWSIGDESAVLNARLGRVVYRFHARDLYLVMGTGGQRKPVRFRIRVDGRPPGTAHGLDVDAQGRGTLTEHRLYQLIRQRKPVVDRNFQIEFLDPGAELYSFTFG
jgi:thiol-disulfide isomerase/thioredoxin